MEILAYTSLHTRTHCPALSGRPDLSHGGFRFVRLIGEGEFPDRTHTLRHRFVNVQSAESHAFEQGGYRCTAGNLRWF